MQFKSLGSKIELMLGQHMTVANHNLSPNAQDTIKNDKSIFIWLDILGFADAVENEKEYFELAEKLRKFQILFNEYDGYTAKIISDGIILKINSNYLLKLMEVFQRIGEKQLEFILENNEFIRGGIAVGTKYQDHTYISNGLARAVKLETTFINYPIIGTDKKNILEIQKLLLSDHKEFFGLMQSFNKRGEDLYFIDFITNDRDYLQLLNAKISEFEKKPIIRDKYIWLLRYYLHKYSSENPNENLEGIVL